MVSTWLYVPNLIGYVRIITGLAAFMYAFDKSQHGTFFMLYAFSYALDAVDGVAARALKQTSRFGAVLDMVTDRFCTAGLLAVLAHLFQEHPLHYVFIWLMILDIVSHWAQMYRCAGADALDSAAANTGIAKRPLTDTPAFSKAFLVCLQPARQRRCVAQDAAGRAPAAALLLHLPLRAVHGVPAERGVPAVLLHAQARGRRRVVDVSAAKGHAYGRTQQLCINRL